MVVMQKETVIEENDLNGIGIGTVKTVWHKFEVLDKRLNCTKLE